MGYNPSLYALRKGINHGMTGQKTRAIVSASSGKGTRAKESHMVKPHRLTEEALAQIFTKARTHSGWLSEPVSDELLRQIYHNPARFRRSARHARKIVNNVR